MGRVGALRGRRAYFDANIFIYAVEGSAEHAAFLDELFDAFDHGDTVAVTSELTLAEVLAKPLATGREDVAHTYEAMVAPSAWLSVVPVERSILLRAARLGPELGLKLPDAIHVATAEAGGRAAFLSNDRRMRVTAGIILLELT
jgi:predicted nucleic acid-binding protein